MDILKFPLMILWDIEPDTLVVVGFMLQDWCVSLMIMNDMA